jgi:hypothetical protein
LEALKAYSQGDELLVSEREKLSITRAYYWMVTGETDKEIETDRDVETSLSARHGTSMIWPLTTPFFLAVREGQGGGQGGGQRCDPD